MVLYNGHFSTNCQSVWKTMYMTPIHGKTGSNKQTRNELTDRLYHKPLYLRVALLEAESCGMESQLDELKEVG